jgi:hypothetical protein
MQIDDDLFRQELAPIVFRHMQTAKRDPEQLANVYETLASMLGSTVAEGCGGDAKMMGVMLEGLAQHMMEVAAERAPLMKLLSQFGGVK